MEEWCRLYGLEGLYGLDWLEWMEECECMRDAREGDIALQRRG